VGIIAIFGFVFLMTTTFTSLYYLLNKFSSQGAAILFSYQALAISLFLLIQIIPTMTVDFFDENSYCRYFLLLPFRRETLVLTTFILSVSGAFLPVAILLPATIGYIIATHNIAVIVGIISFVIFLFGLALMGSVISIRLFNTATLRKLGKWAMFLNLLIFIVYWNLFTKFNFESTNQGSISINFLTDKLEQLTISFPLLWIYFSAFNGYLISSAILLTFGILFWRIGWEGARKLSFESPFNISRARKTKLKIETQLWKYPWISRDLLLFWRDTENFLLLVYPLIFAIFLGLLSGKAFIQGFAFAIMLASQGLMVTSVKLLSNDTRNSRLVCTLPIKIHWTVINRAISMTLLWTMTVIISGLFFLIALKIIYPLYALIIPIGLCFFGNSLIAQNIWLSNPGDESVSPKSVLGIQAVGYSLAPTLIGILPLIIIEINKIIQFNGLKNILFLSAIAIAYIMAGIYFMICIMVVNKDKIRKHFYSI